MKLTLLKSTRLTELCTIISLISTTVLLQKEVVSSLLVTSFSPLPPGPRQPCSPSCLCRSARSGLRVDGLIQHVATCLAFLKGFKLEDGHLNFVLTKFSLTAVWRVGQRAETNGRKRTGCGGHESWSEAGGGKRCVPQHRAAGGRLSQGLWVRRGTSAAWVSSGFWLE